MRARPLVSLLAATAMVAGIAGTATGEERLPLDPPTARLVTNVLRSPWVGIESRELRQPVPYHSAAAETIRLDSYPLGGEAYAVSPDGTQVVYRIGGDAGELRLRDVWGGPELVLPLPEPPGGSPDAVDVAFSPDGGQLAYVAGPEVHVRDLDRGTDRVIHRVDVVRDVTFDCSGGDATTVAWSARGDWLLVGTRSWCGDGPPFREQMLMRPDGDDVRREVGHGPTSFSPDGRWLAEIRSPHYWSVEDRHVVVTDLDDMTVRATAVDLVNPSWVDAALEWTTDQEVIGTVGAGSANTVGLLDVATEVLDEIDFAQTVRDVTVTEDGRTVVAAVGEDGTARQLVVVDRSSGDRRTVGAEESPGGVYPAVGEGVVFETSTHESGSGPAGWRSRLWHLDTVSMTTTQVTEDLTPDGQFHDPMVSRAVAGPVFRYAGEDRTRTAIALAQGVHDDVDTLVVARSDDYADALAASSLAGELGAPLLLTPRNLPGHVRRAVQRLAPEHVVVVGDTEAVDADAERRLREAPSVESVTRVAGPTRYDTAAAIADRVGLPADRTVFLVEGWDADPARGWADAVAVAGVAARDRRPILLTETGSLPAATADAIRRLSPDRVVVVGGPVAVDQSVIDQVRALGVDVNRIAGATRYATSRGVAEAYPATGPAADRLWAVTGENWPDALAAGAAAGTAGGDLLLVRRDGLGDEAARYLHDRARPPGQVVVSGSTAAVPAAVSRALRRAATP